MALRTGAALLFAACSTLYAQTKPYAPNSSADEAKTIRVRTLALYRPELIPPFRAASRYSERLERAGPLAVINSSWIGGTGNWGNSTNWSPTGVPNNGGGNTYNVNIELAGSLVSLNLNATIASLTVGINGGSISTLQNTFGTAETLEVTGATTIDLTGALNFANASVLKFDRGLTVDGSFTLDGATATIGANGTFNYPATAELTGTSTLTVNGNLTNSALFKTGGGGNTVTVKGDFTNSGGLVGMYGSLNGGAGDTLNVTGTLTNNGGGTLSLYDNSGDVANVGTLSNSGAVYIGSGTTFNLTNQPNGITDVPAVSSLTVNGTLKAGSANGLANLTSVEGGLYLQNGKTTAVTPSGGTLSVAPGGTLNLANPGTTLSVTGGLNDSGSITVGAGTTLNVTNGITDLPAASLLDVQGTLSGLANLKDVEGTLYLHNGQTTSDTPSGGALTVSGVADVAGASTLTVKGGLTVLGHFYTGLYYGGGNTLTVKGDVTNNGALEISGGGDTLNVTGALINNAGASLSLSDSSGVANVGTLSNSSSDVYIGSGTMLNLTTSGSDSNAGVIVLNGTLGIKAKSTLSGKGVVDMTGGTITGTGSTLFSNNTIEGSGTISNLGITNLGTLLANQSAPLIILPTSAGLNNRGTISVSARDTMQIGTSAGGALVNFSGNTLTGGNYDLSGTLQLGASGTSLMTNAARITLNGRGGRMIDFGNNNILAGLNNNTTAGVFRLASGATLTTSGGSFTNAGIFTVGKGSTFTVGGSSFNFTQTGGTTTVDGTLSSTSLGTLNLNGGSLFGAGTLAYNVVDAATVIPGDSATKTGVLSISDTYSQSSAGAMDIAIGGTTAGSQYDQVKVRQSATLGGTLSISLVNGFTPAIGSSFTILTASGVSGTFVTVTGLEINSGEHFTIAYNPTSVVLTVVSGAAKPAILSTAPVHPGLVPPRHRGYEQALYHPSPARLMAPAITLPTARAALSHHPAGAHRFRPMDVSPGAGTWVPASADDLRLSAHRSVAPVSAAALNRRDAMNHMRFECGVDVTGLLKTGPKRLLHGLFADPDSPNAISIGYLTYNGSH